MNEKLNKGRIKLIKKQFIQIAPLSTKLFIIHVGNEGNKASSCGIIVKDTKRTKSG